MPTEKTPPKDRVATSFTKLTAASEELKAAVSDLTTNIRALERRLEPLNLGVSAWHTIAGNDDENGCSWSRDVGYTQMGDEWRIALRKTWSYPDPSLDDEKIWMFDTAPRWMCVEAVGKLPDLFDDLVKRTEETIKKIKNRSVEAKELNEAIWAVLKDQQDAAITAEKAK